MLLFGIVQVYPRIAVMASPGFRIPYYVESTFELFGPNGSIQRRHLVTSFPYGGNDINMAVIQLHNSPLDHLREIVASLRTRLILAMPSTILPKHPPMTEPAWHVEYVRSGCSSRPTVIGHEAIAGYDTTVVQNAFPAHRFTFWFAPELGCAALKQTYEVRQPDGAFRMLTRKEAVRVTIVEKN
jgi:hypothetical protein